MPFWRVLGLYFSPFLSSLLKSYAPHLFPPKKPRFLKNAKISQIAFFKTSKPRQTAPAAFFQLFSSATPEKVGMSLTGWRLFCILPWFPL
jgi:hypothetical protein